MIGIFLRKINYMDLTGCACMFWLQQLLLKQIPTCFELKFRAYSLLSRCYQLVGTLAVAKQTLKKGLELSTNAGVGYVLMTLTRGVFLILQEGNE